MTIRGIAREIAKREGKKSEARMGDIAEIVSILSDLMWEDQLGEIEILLANNGARRAKRKPKKKV